MEKLDVVNAALGALKAGKTCELVVVAGTAGSSPRGVGAGWPFCRWQPSGYHRRRQNRALCAGRGPRAPGRGAVAPGPLHHGRRELRYRHDLRRSICLCYLHLDATKQRCSRRLPTSWRIAASATSSSILSRLSQALSKATLPNAWRGVAPHHGGLPRAFACGGGEQGHPHQRRLRDSFRAHRDALPRGPDLHLWLRTRGRATARVLTAAGFAVVACDDRPGTLTPEWVPGVYDRRLVDYKNLGELCPIGPRDLVVVATAGHKSDIDVVIQAMRAKPATWAAWARVARRPLYGPAWSRRVLRRNRSTDCTCRSALPSRRRTPRRSPSPSLRDDPPAPHQTRPPQALVTSPYMSCGEIGTV